MMNLVIGATGLVGSHLTLQLLQQNKEVVASKRADSDILKTKKVFSYYTTNADELFNKIKWVDADVLDIHSLIAAMDNIKTVYHCAGLVSFNKNDNTALHKINTLGTANVVNACIDKSIQTLCYVSSIATLQNPDVTKDINENLFWKYSPRVSEYAVSKYNAEREVFRGAEEGLNTVIVNPGVIIGPGFWNQSSGKLIESCYKGTAFYTTGTTGFIDVRDVCNCMLLLTEKKEFNRRYILIENNYSYKDILLKLHENFNKKQPSIEAGFLLLKIASVLDGLAEKLFKKSRVLTKEIVISALDKTTFDNSLIKQTLNVRFISMDDSIRFVCKLYLKDKSVNE